MVQHIAIIGSGMAGLAASWFLGEKHKVTLFERQPRLGIGAHSVQASGGVVDVPLRVIYPGYYPELFALLAQTGVAVEPLDASLGFSDLGGACYFRYRNLHALGKTLPWVTPGTWLRSTSRDILFDLGRFLWQAPRALAAGDLADRTIGDYLDLQKYSSTFTDRFLIPAFAGINTVSCQEVRDYPAEVIAQYFNRDFIVSSVYRAVGGAQAIAQALTTRVAHLRLGAHIRSVRRQANTVAITMEDGSAETFDTVVFATQANQVMAMMDDASPDERSVLGAVRYGTVRVVMHHDTRLMPTERADWCPVNYLLAPQFDRPMVSIWVNRLLPAYQDARPLFQTINPLVEPASELVLQDCSLQRPVVDLATQANPQRLEALHVEPERRVFFCGSYAAPGIPLLESAVASVRRVVQAAIQL
ncbi:MAG: FAD-dependent oxidoreductase [Burkholderiales bacterium]|nr:FAD-dependent oxidoreductase [Burkholderiales bacterium]